MQCSTRIRVHLTGFIITKDIEHEGIMLNEINPTKKDKHCMISLKADLIETGTKMVINRGCRFKKRDADQRVQTSSYKMNEFWGSGSNVPHGNCS